MKLIHIALKLALPHLMTLKTSIIHYTAHPFTSVPHLFLCITPNPKTYVALKGLLVYCHIPFS